MKTFPSDLIKPASATLSGEVGNGSVNISLEPFTIGDETIEAEIVADLVNLPTHDFSSLAKTVHEFPVNPEDGYIEASVYIEHAHHPVDINKLTFGEVNGETIQVTADANFVFSLEVLSMNCSPTYLFDNEILS